MCPPSLAVAVRQRRGRRPAGVGGALLVPGASLLACVERAADAHPSGEVGAVCHGSAADVVGRWGGNRRPLSWRTVKGWWEETEEDNGGRKGKEQVMQRRGEADVQRRKEVQIDLGGIRSLEGVIRNQAERRKCK